MKCEFLFRFLYIILFYFLIINSNARTVILKFIIEYVTEITRNLYAMIWCRFDSLSKASRFGFGTEFIAPIHS
jgi:hypothetical protein